MGKEALREVAAAPPNRFKTLRLEGEELPEYGAAVTKEGEDGRRADLPGDESRVRSDRPRDPPDPTWPPRGRSVDVALGEGTIGATVDVLAVHDPEKRRPRELTAQTTFA